MRNKARVLVVDDHQAVRRGLSDLLDQEPDLTVVAAVESAEQALAMVEDHPIDLAIVDICLGQMDGLELTRRLRSQYPGVHIVILSMHERSTYADKAIQAGASGYVAKPEAGEILLATIHQVLDEHMQSRNVTPPLS
jgi:DNA-binding NarL/FixJ family response regulator